MFRTARLAIGQLGPDDYDRMLQIYGDPEGARWVGDGQPISPEDCARWVDVTLSNYATRGYGMSAVRLLGAAAAEGLGEIVGFAGLVHPGGQEVPELKYAFAREHWGRGFATEVGSGMLAYGASTFGMARIIATAAPENLASLRVLEKVGMVDIGTHIDDDGEAVVTYEWTAPGGS